MSSSMSRSERDAEWHRLHCHEGKPLREIARAQGVPPSTVLRGVRRHEDMLNDDAVEPSSPPPPSPEEQAMIEFKNMQHVHRFYRLGYLTPDHVAGAIRFKKNSKAYRAKVPPTMWRILNFAIVEERPIGELEEAEGLPARAGKGVLRILLSMLVQMETLNGAGHEPDDEPDDVDYMREQIEFLTADDPDVYLPFMTQLGMTQTQARLMTILSRSNGRVVTREALFRRLYGLRADDEMPDAKILDVIVCKTRKLLEGTVYRIETIYQTGYRLIVETEGDTCHDRLTEGVV